MFRQAPGKETLAKGASVELLEKLQSEGEGWIVKDDGHICFKSRAECLACISYDEFGLVC